MLKNLWNKLVSLFNQKKEEIKTKAVEAAKGWTEEQVHELVEMYINKASKAEITEKTGRTLNSINAKLTEIFGTCKSKK